MDSANNNNNNNNDYHYFPFLIKSGNTNIMMMMMITQSKIFVPKQDDCHWNCKYKKHCCGCCKNDIIIRLLMNESSEFAIISCRH